MCDNSYTDSDLDYQKRRVDELQETVDRLVVVLVDTNATITVLAARVAALEASGKLVVETVCPDCQARKVSQILARQAREASL